MLDEIIEELTLILLKNHKNSENNDKNEEKKYIITKNDLIKFSIKLIKETKKVYDR